jgi:WD40 repeat protein
MKTRTLYRKIKTFENPDDSYFEPKANLFFLSNPNAMMIKNRTAVKILALDDLQVQQSIPVVEGAFCEHTLWEFGYSQETQHLYLFLTGKNRHGGFVEIRDLPSGKKQGRFALHQIFRESHPMYINGFSHHGHYAYGYSPVERAYLLDLTTHRYCYLPSADILKLVVSNQENYLLQLNQPDFIHNTDQQPEIYAISKENGLRLERHTILKGHSDAVESAVFTPDSRYCLTLSNDGTVRKWDVSTGDEVHRVLLDAEDFAGRAAYNLWLREECRNRSLDFEEVVYYQPAFVKVAGGCNSLWVGEYLTVDFQSNGDDEYDIFSLLVHRFDVETLQWKESIEVGRMLQAFVSHDGRYLIAGDEWGKLDIYVKTDES